MRPHRVIWLEIARDQYARLSRRDQGALNQLLGRLAADPHSVTADYDSASDQWLADFADGTGLMSYALVPANRCIVVLRLLTFS